MASASVSALAADAANVRTRARAAPDQSARRRLDISVIPLRPTCGPRVLYKPSEVLTSAWRVKLFSRTNGEIPSRLELECRGSFETCQHRRRRIEQFTRRGEALFTQKQAGL